MATSQRVFRPLKLTTGAESAFPPLTFAITTNGTVTTNLLDIQSEDFDLVPATAPESLRDSYFGTATFFFSGNVPIIAGNTYFLVPTLQAGDDSSVYGGFYNYPNGTAYYIG